MNLKRIGFPPSKSSWMQRFWPGLFSWPLFHCRLFTTHTDLTAEARSWEISSFLLWQWWCSPFVINCEFCQCLYFLFKSQFVKNSILRFLNKSFSQATFLTSYLCQDGLKERPFITNTPDSFSLFLFSFIDFDLLFSSHVIWEFIQFCSFYCERALLHCSPCSLFLSLINS